MENPTESISAIKKYYGQTIRSRKDLKTGACCSVESQPSHIKGIIDQLSPEVVDKHYGCGSPIPPLLDGCTVLDLGCGAGQDVFVASKLVGETGKVIGVDMSEQQLDMAGRHIDFHMSKFKYSKRNVEFIKGCIENSALIGIEDNSIVSA